MKFHFVGGNQNMRWPCRKLWMVVTTRFVLKSFAEIWIQHIRVDVSYILDEKGLIRDEIRH